MTVAARYRSRADEFERKVAAVRPDQWSNQSPCADWTALDVLRHVIVMQQAMLAPLGQQLQEPPDPERNPLQAFRSARADVEAVLVDQAVSAREVLTPNGPMSVADHIDQVASADLVLHGWDLARATGQDEAIDPAEVELMWAANSSIPAAVMQKLRTPGAFGPGIVVYGPEIPVPDDAPLQDRLLGLIGRDPR